MKKIIKLIIFTCLIAGSCSKGFLEVTDKTVLLKQGYVTDLSTTGDYLNGVYVRLATRFFSGNELPYGEMTADNMKPVIGGSFSSQYSWDQLANSTGESNMNALWQTGYAMIRDCSFVVAAADRYRQENPAKADDLKGQALGIRALVHFVLVNTFAQHYGYTEGGGHPGVPYITTDDIGTAVSRQSVAEVYAGMENDLKTAMSLLEAAPIVIERFNYQAAKALLARVYLFSGEFAPARDLAVEILGDVPPITDDYPGAWYTPRESEALFRLPPGAYADGYEVIFTGYYTNPAALNYLATEDVALLLTAQEDDRRAAWVTASESGWLVTKFPEGAVGTFPLPYGDYYEVLLRSTEMCLTAAEACAELGQEEEARRYLDIIRQRAIPGTAPATESGEQLRDAIRLERRKELAFDGLRMFDLQRWQLSVYREDATSEEVRYLPYPSDRAISPIPQQDVDLSGLTQNKGY